MRKILATAAVLLLATGAPAAASGTGIDAAAQAAPTGKAKPAVIGGVADPVKWVRDSYDPAGRAAFVAANPPGAGAAAEAPASDPGYSARPEFSPRLRALFRDDEKYAGGEVGRLDFNPFSGAQDDDIKGAEVTFDDVDGAPDRKIVTAKFRNMDARQTITYFWERIGGRWYIDDIAGQAAGEPAAWTLSLILKYGRSGV
jgi:hypothetical protein